MSWQAGFTLAVLAVLVYGLVRFTHVVDVIFLGGLTLLALAGVITPAQALAGFSNEGVLTIAGLFVVAAGLVETGLLGSLAQRILGRIRSPQQALRRVVPAVAAISAFLNNTTVVAMCLPTLLDWSRKQRIAPSKLLLPLSYAAILGGVCTLIGTSTNLVVHGMLKAAGMQGLGLWELGAAGIPIAVLGSIFLIVVGPRWLPDRKEFLEQLGESRREFLVEMIAQPSCPLVGQTIEAAGLRHLPGLFLIEIEREGQVIPAVDPKERLLAWDRLVFTGVVATIVDLQKVPGLVAAGDPGLAVAGEARGREAAGPQGGPRRVPDEGRAPLELGQRRGLYEAVISSSSPLVGRGIRDAQFRTIYDAAVIAVHRNGVRVRQKIGDIVLHPGDTLLLLAGPGFIHAHRNNPDFYLVSEAGSVAPIRREKAPYAAAIVLSMLAVMTLPDVLEMLGVHTPLANAVDQRRVIFVLLAAGAMIVTRCVSAAGARRSIEWPILVVIGAALGIGKAMETSGAADALAGLVIGAAHHFGPLGVLAGVYLVTWLTTEIMSNNAAAALMFPIAVAAARTLHVDPRPFAIIVALAASAGFVSPMGYQTHLMVFGPGGYKLSDFLKVGLPMCLLWFATSMILVPFFWPLHP
ncbi:MAG TPA: SLC13 family permease [Phycisphaerae bacterium]